MKYYTFNRESNNFDDILKDPVLKRKMPIKIKWDEHLMVGISEKEEQLLGYLILKYSDDMCNPIEKDYTPIPNVDYVPERKINSTL